MNDYVIQVVKSGTTYNIYDYRIPTTVTATTTDISNSDTLIPLASAVYKTVIASGSATVSNGYLTITLKNSSNATLATVNLFQTSTETIEETD